MAETKIVTNIRTLCIRSNGIKRDGAEALASSLAFKQLDGLIASKNQIPSSATHLLLQNMHRLGELYLDENRIDSLGAMAIAHSEFLQHLAYLALSDNPIETEGIAAIGGSRRLFNLKDLTLGNNGEKEAAWDVWAREHYFPNLLRLVVSNSPNLKSRHLIPLLRDLLPGPTNSNNRVGGSLSKIAIRGCTGLGLTDSELQLADPAQVYRALLRKRSEDAMPLLEIKLAILGMGGVGKSSIAARLVGRERYTGGRTHDINFIKAPAPLLHPKVSCRIFDFGGQVELHATHRFYLQSRRTCYLLMLDGSKKLSQNPN